MIGSGLVEAAPGLVHTAYRRLKLRDHVFFCTALRCGVWCERSRLP